MEDAAGGMRGFLPALTSFIGRTDAVDEVAGLLAKYRLVTVTGPGGVGKTRLAGEVARRVVDSFADGVWLVELASLREPALVTAAVAAVLGKRQAPGMSVMDSLAGVLARQQLLLVLDNCEHMAEAVAELCRALLSAADDVKILTTGREPIKVAGEARYRLPPLGLPKPGDDPAAADSEAVALFADRARQLDPNFALSIESAQVVARLVARLDGMPLAIELAAAQVEALGLVQLLDRLDDRFRLLVGADRTAAARQQSLAATVDWSYQLLPGREQRVFRRLAVFPGPFTLDAAEAVAGADGPTVVHLVDCSWLAPPRTGLDGRARYVMLETLRAFGLERLADAGEQREAAAELARYALQVAEEAAAGLQTSAGELGAARWLDAEDATVYQGLTWALVHDPAAALRLAVALSPWWRLRGRSAAGYALLRAAAGHTARGEDAWSAAQYLLGQAANNTGEFDGALEHFTAVCDALAQHGASLALVDALASRSNSLRNLDRVPEAADDARSALDFARELGYPAGEALALIELGFAAYYADNPEEALVWARQAQRIDPASISGWLARLCGLLLTLALYEVGEVAAAESGCEDGLARAREAGDLQDQADWLWLMAELDRQAGRLPEAGVHLQETVQIAVQIGNRLRIIDCLDSCGQLCAARHQWAEALTMWAAFESCNRDAGLPDLPQDANRRQEPRQNAAGALGRARTRAAEERGTAMTLTTAAELATMLTVLGSQPQLPSVLGNLSARERELVTLVAQGRTDTQIAGQLHISVRTVRSHLDRIRDKSGCRRRADLTRLALQAGLV